MKLRMKLDPLKYKIPEEIWEKYEFTSSVLWVDASHLTWARIKEKNAPNKLCSVQKKKPQTNHQSQKDLL